MSSPATSTFLSYWRDNASRRPVTLAKIEITAPSAETLYVATSEVTTPDGQTWESGLQCDAISQRIERLDPGPALASLTFRLANRTYATLAGARLDAQLASYRFQGATVTFWFWNDVRHPTTGAHRLAWADALCVFASGRIDSAPGVGDSWIEFTAIQDQSWNNPVPTTVVDSITYPNAPDISQGRPIPIVYGDFRALPMRSPWTATYTDKDDQENAGAGLGVVPLLLVDPGLGAANVKLVGAGHALTDLLSRSTGYSSFIVANDVLAPLDTTGITETLGATESYLTINDDTLVAYYGVRPLEPRATYNTADNSRRAADPFNETTYASIDQNTSKNVVQLSLPSVASLGYIEAVTVEVAFVGNAGNTSTLRVRPQIPGGANGTAVTATLADSQSTTPKILSGTWDSAYWTQNWQFGGNTTGSPWDIRVDFTGGTTNKASILWAILKVKYRPQRNLVTPAYIEGDRFATTSDPSAALRLLGISTSGDLSLGVFGTYRAKRQSLSGQFFANLKGYADDGSGTYTGSAGALIERPCDIVRHFLETYGGLSSSDFETGATSFGSFAYARDLLRNAAPSDYKLACWIGEKTSVQQVVVEIARQSLGLVMLDRFTGKWHFQVWRKGPAADYDLTLSPLELPDLFEPSVVSDVTLAQGIRVQWGWDAFRNRSLFETFVTADGSAQGYNYPATRDQNSITIATGVNDKLNWRETTGAQQTETLTAATYSPIDLANHIQTKLRTKIVTLGHATAEQVCCGVGFTIKAAYNDVAELTYNASTVTATLDAGDYTADELCVELADKLNAAVGSEVFSCAYDQGDNTFTLTSNALSFTLRYSLNATNKTKLVWMTLGMCTNYPTTGTSYTSEVPAYAELFWIRTFVQAIDVLWSSGTNAATSCAEACGYLKTDQSAVNSADAALTRALREAACAASQATFGPRKDMDVQAPWVRDESSAQRFRDGIFDFGATPPVRLKFRSHACPDIRLGQTFTVSADMDARRPYPGYGSDGSWAGKVMRVTEIRQDMGPSYHTEILAEDA